MARNDIIYAFCPQCGAKLAIMDGIFVIKCNDCNINLQYNQEYDVLEILGRDVQFVKGKVYQYTGSGPGSTTLGQKRIYILYFLFGLSTLGIGSIVYLMRNLKDLALHQNHDVEKNANPILSQGETFTNFNQILQNRLYYSPYYMIPLFVITIAYDLISAAEDKYSALYYHLKEQEKETAPYKSPHSGLFLTSLIALIVSLAVEIPVAITSFIYSQPYLSVTFYVMTSIAGVSLVILIICEALWQRAFNTHIDTMRRLGYK